MVEIKPIKNLGAQRAENSKATQEAERLAHEAIMREQAEPLLPSVQSSIKKKLEEKYGGQENAAEPAPTPTQE